MELLSPIHTRGTSEKKLKRVRSHYGSESDEEGLVRVGSVKVSRQKSKQSEGDGAGEISEKDLEKLVSDT